MAGKTGARDFYDFEKELHARLMEAEREIVGGVMSASDVDADAIEIAGRVHRRVLRSTQTYMTAAGPVSVERWLYKDRSVADRSQGARPLRPSDGNGCPAAAGARRNGAAHWQIDDDLAAVVVRVGETFVERGGSFHATAVALNAAGVPSPGGATWSPQTVKNVLKHPLY